MNPSGLNLTYSDELQPVIEYREGEIPVQFDYKGETFRGVLSSVKGAGAPTYYLNDILNFYHGQLVYSQYQKKWRFTSQAGKFEDVESYFVELVIAAENRH